MRRTGLALLLLLVAFALPGCGGGEEEAEAGSETSEEALTLTLAEQAGSGQSGTATLTADGDNKTRVVVELSNAPGPAQPSHVHSGSCDDIGPVVAPLENVEGGDAESVVLMPLDELQRGGLLVHAHKSEAESKVSVACAEIPKAESAAGGYGY
jgi:hypothetical protein